MAICGALIAQHLDDEGGRGEGKAGAEEQRHRPACHELAEVGGDHQRRDDDLQRSEPEQRPPQIPQSPRLHFQADQEEQQHHAEFGEVTHILHLGGDEWTRRVRADDDPGDQQPEDRPQTEMPEDGDGDRRDDQEKHRGIDERFRVHAPVSYKVGAASFNAPPVRRSRSLLRRRWSIQIEVSTTITCLGNNPASPKLTSSAESSSTSL